MAFKRLLYGLALYAFSASNLWAGDVPTNTIVGSSGKKMKVENKRSPAAQNKKIKVYKYKDDGIASFSDRPPKGQHYEVLSFRCFACDVHSTLDWNHITLYPQKYAATIEQAAKQHGVEAALVRAIIHAESAFNPKAISRTGAMGLMQLMPETAKEMGVKNAFVAEQNILGGTKYLAQMLTRFDGDIALACAAYNAGPTVVSQLNAIPPYPETQAYVERVQILLKRYRKLG